MSELQADIYKTDFEKFLSCTDEKPVLLREILKDVQRFGARSVLDIGAGNGLIGVPLSKAVSKYLAVEKNTNFSEYLRRNGLEVIQDVFPTEIKESFDLVLASHCISYLREKYEPFLRAAWDLVSSGGTFLLITFRGQGDDWTRFLGSIGLGIEAFSRVGFNKMIELLFSLGDIKTRKVVTRVRARTSEDMIDALSFVYSNADITEKAKFLNKRSRIEKILESQYKNSLGYEFPFQHFFVYIKHRV